MGRVIFFCFLSFLTGLIYAQDSSNSSQDNQTRKLTIVSFGELGGLYNQGLGSRGVHSYGNIMAHAGVNFILDNGWDFGFGAIGSWVIWNKNVAGRLGIFQNQSGSTLGSGNQGDVSEAFIHYKNSRLEFSLGRFNSNFINFDYLSGNIQGAAGAITTGNTRYWLAFVDSILYTGAHRNTFSTLFGLNDIFSYYPSAKTSILGRFGEVISGGIDYKNNKGFESNLFLFLNTQLPANVQTRRNEVLVQVGGRVGYETDFAGEWNSSTKFRGLFQIGNTSNLPASSLNLSDSFAGLLWLDQSFKYRIFEFGGGIYSILSSFHNGGIYTLSDPSRFYGKIVNSLGMFPSPYFSSGSSSQFINGYIFGDIDLMRSSLPFKVSAIIGFGHYQEYTFMVDYNAWRHKYMKLNLGIGYVFSKPSNSFVLNNSNLQSSLLIFTKFFY